MLKDRPTRAHELAGAADERAVGERLEELEALRDGVRAVLRLVEHVHACPPEQAAAGVPPSAAPGRVPAAVAASRLGVSIATVRRLVAGGELAGCALRVPGRKRRAWYVDADALAALEPGRVALGATGARTPAVPPPRE